MSRARRPLHLSQHPYEHGPDRPVLLAVDQQLGERSALRVGPELANPPDPLEDPCLLGGSRPLDTIDGLSEVRMRGWFGRVVGGRVMGDGAVGVALILGWLIMVVVSGWCGSQKAAAISRRRFWPCCSILLFCYSSCSRVQDRPT